MNALEINVKEFTHTYKLITKEGTEYLVDCFDQFHAMEAVSGLTSKRIATCVNVTGEDNSQFNSVTSLSHLAMVRVVSEVQYDY